MKYSTVKAAFKGQNFMTPHPIAYYHGEVRGKAAYIELSEGSGIGGGPLYGVTFRRPNGQELWREEEGMDGDPSGCFRSLQQAREHIDQYKGTGPL